MKNCIVYIVSVVFLISCSNTKTENERKGSFTTINVKSDWEMNPGMKLSNLVKKIDFVQLETTDDCLLGEIEKVDTWKESVYVLEKPAYRSAGIYQFDKNGKFIRRIGTKGEGPIEFVEMTDFSINSETGNIYIYDAVRMKALEYQADGSFVQSISIGYRGHKIEYSKGLLYFYEYCADDGASTDKVYITDLKGNVKAHYLPRSKCPVRFKNAGFSKTKENEILCFEIYNDTVYSFDKEKLFAKYVFDFGELAMSDEEKDNYFEAVENEQKLEQRQSMLKNHFFGPNRLRETKNWLFFTLGKDNVEYMGIYDKKNQCLQLQTSFVDDLYELFPFLTDDLVGGSSSGLIAARNSNALILSIEKDFPKKVNSGKMTLDKCDSLTTIFSRYLPVNRERQKNMLNHENKEKEDLTFEGAMAAMYGDREDELNPILLFIEFKE